MAANSGPCQLQSRACVRTSVQGSTNAVNSPGAGRPNAASCAFAAGAAPAATGSLEAARRRGEAPSKLLLQAAGRSIPYRVG